MIEGEVSESGTHGQETLGESWKAKPKGKIKYPEAQMKDVLLSDARTRSTPTMHGSVGCIMGDDLLCLEAIEEANYQITFQQLHKASTS